MYAHKASFSCRYRLLTSLATFHDPEPTMEPSNNQHIVEALTKTIEGLKEDVERIKRRIAELEALKERVDPKPSHAPSMIGDFDSDMDANSA
ncbi:hypothetical protein Neosp_008969 [[Neocosmospora] mangrovei]